jgi:hypothetical protein
LCRLCDTPLPGKVGTNFSDKWRPLSRETENNYKIVLKDLKGRKPVVEAWCRWEIILKLALRNY